MPISRPRTDSFVGYVALFGPMDLRNTSVRTFGRGSLRGEASATYSRRMYFVCRWREESPFSKRVVTLPDASVLNWFRRGWDRDSPEDWIADELGGDVYGLDSIFEKAREQNLPKPQSVVQLRALLHEHLWVEGDDKRDCIRLDEHTLRVRTDDDEVDLAYYFIDEVAAAASPDRLGFLLYDTWPLPGNADGVGAVFSNDVPVRAVQLGPAGPESVFSVRLSWESPDTVRNLDLQGAIEFTGVDLPRLAAGLRDVGDREADDFPNDARLLRALVASGQDQLGPALQHYARLPGYSPSLSDIESVPAQADDRRSTASLVQLDTRIAQAARYIDDFVGFDQWFLFDTQWAAAQPDLARSLLRYAAHWDPYDSTHSSRTPEPQGDRSEFLVSDGSNDSVRQPHISHRCPRCESPLSLRSATAAGHRDVNGKLLSAREFRRCVECLSIAVRVQEEAEWHAVPDLEVPDRVRFMVSLL